VARYAEGTKVSIENSKAEIEKILMRYGAEQFMSGWNREEARIMFQYGGWVVRFKVPLPDPMDGEFTLTPTGRERSEKQATEAWEQEVRRRWRALTLLIKAKLEAVTSDIGSEAQLVTFEEEFMPYIVGPNDQTIAEAFLPQMKRALAEGTMPKALPFLG
jgi:hypothetical protein